MLHPDDRKKAVAWAFLTAKAFGYRVSEEGSMFWVHTGTNEIGCDSLMDFVGFMSEESARRAKGGK